MAEKMYGSVKHIFQDRREVFWWYFFSNIYINLLSFHVRFCQNSCFKKYGMITQFDCNFCPVN